MLRLAFDFIITWRETRTRPNAYVNHHKNDLYNSGQFIVFRTLIYVGFRCFSNHTIPYAYALLFFP